MNHSGKLMEHSLIASLGYRIRSAYLFPFTVDRLDSCRTLYRPRGRALVTHPDWHPAGNPGSPPWVPVLPRTYYGSDSQCTLSPKHFYRNWKTSMAGTNGSCTPGVIHPQSADSTPNRSRIQVSRENEAGRINRIRPAPNQGHQSCDGGHGWLSTRPGGQLHGACGVSPSR